MAYVPLKEPSKRAYVPLAQVVKPEDYKGTLGEMTVAPIAPTVKTSTQAIPDETTGGGGIFKLLEGVGQGAARSAAAFGVSLAAVPGRIADVAAGRMPQIPFGEDVFPVPHDGSKLEVFNRKLFGTDEPISFRSVGAELPFVPEKGPIAPILGVALGGLDLTGAGEGVKGLKGLSTALKDVKTVEEASKLMKNAGFAENIIKDYAPTFAKAKDTKLIENGLLSAEHLQNSTIPRAYTPLAEATKKAAENTRIAEEVATKTSPYIEAIRVAKPEDVESVGSLMRQFDESLATARSRGFDNLDEFYKANPGSIKPALFEPLKTTTNTFTETFKDLGRTIPVKNGETIKLSMTPQEIFEKVINGDAKVNTKLEVMAKQARNFETFFDRTGVTRESLDLTARKKGYVDAEDFYTKNREATTPVPDELGSYDELSKQSRDLNLPELPRFAPSALQKSIEESKTSLGEARVVRDVGREVVPDMAGKPLRKFESRSTGELPDVLPKQTYSGKAIERGSKFSKEGDKIAKDLGFDSVDDANKALQDYKKAKTQLIAAEKSVSARVKDYRDRKAVYDEVIRYVKEEGRQRQDKVKLVQDFFKLTDGEMSDLLKGERDLRLMHDNEFDDFMKRLEGKATEAYLRMRDLTDLKATILDKEFIKLDNLRQALKLPHIENMSPEQMRQFNETLKEFKTGDEFLGVRQLETVANTDLKGVKTIREARERLLVDVNKGRESRGLPPATIEDLENVKVNELDRYRYDVALARQNPLYDFMVRETHKATLTAAAEVLHIKEKVNELFKAARESRSRSVLETAIPTDNRIFQWLESSDAQKVLMAKEMTKEELDAGMFVRSWYAEARDYLVQHETLKRYISDYITHIRRGFLEGWLEEARHFQPDVSGAKKPGILRRTGAGLVAAFKEAFQQYKQDEAFFNIMNEKTGNVLPLEKFFQFSMKRTGELVPTKNVAQAFTRYVSTFEKKRMLDALIPKLDIYVHSLTPKKLTPRGLEFDDSLKRFFKQWMNTKKGRAADLVVLKPGGRLDWALRTGVALTRIVDLGLNIPVGIASNIGAQASAFRGLGTQKYALAQSRALTKQGKEILSKYKNLVGESVFEKMRAADSTLGQNITTGVFSLFSFADRKARQAYLLGSMTKKEFEAGAVSADRLADIQLELGRHMPVENMNSIIGKTAIGKVATQYKSWAVPLLSSTLDDLGKMARALAGAKRSGDPQSYLKSTEFAELLRTVVVTSAIGLGVYGIVNDDTPMKQKSFVEKLAAKAAQDGLSLVGALDPSFWTATPRLTQFLNDLATSIKQIVMVEKNKNGDLAGVNKLKQTIIPGSIKQLIPPEEKTSATAGLPGLPKLPKLPSTLPKLPKIK